MKKITDDAVSTSRIQVDTKQPMPMHKKEQISLISKLAPVEKKEKPALSKVDIDKIGHEGIKNRVQDEAKAINMIFKLFPELEFVADITTTLVLTDLGSNNYKVQYDIDHQELPSELKNKLLKVISEHLEKEYSITDNLYDEVYECLYGSGAYVEAILPENIIDDVIAGRIHSDVGLEEASDNISYAATKGLLKPKADKDKDKALESFEVSDNYHMIKAADMSDSLESDSTLGLLDELNFSNETVGDLDIGLEEENILMLRDLQLRSPLGKATVIKLDTGNVIPAIFKNKPSQHRGYFLVLDQNNSPINKDEHNIYDMLDMRAGSHTSNKDHASMSKKAKKLGLITKEDDKITNETVELFTDIINEDLLDRISNNTTSGISLDAGKDLYEVLLFRALNNLKTRIVYIPKELITYTALDYKPNGTGKSVISDIIMIATMRANLLITGYNNDMQNNIMTETLNIKLDERDREPEKSIEMIQALNLRLREGNQPGWSLEPKDINKWSVSAGLRYNIEEHPRLPNTTIEYEQQEAHQKPGLGDKEELIDKLQKAMIFKFGMHPDVLDSLYGAEFASIAEANRVFTERRSLRRRTIKMQHTTDKVVKILRADRVLYDNIIKVMESEKSLVNSSFLKDTSLKWDQNNTKLVNYIIGVISKSLVCTLPSQRMDSDNKVAEAFSQYLEELDTVIEVIIQEDELGLIDSDVMDQRDAVIAIWKNTLARKWMRNNNYLVDVLDIVSVDIEGDAIIDLEELVETHLSNFSDSVLPMMKKLKKLQVKLEKEMEKLNAEEEEEPEEDPVEQEDVEETPEETAEEPEEVDDTEEPVEVDDAETPEEDPDKEDL